MQNYEVPKFLRPQSSIDQSNEEFTDEITQKHSGDELDSTENTDQKLYTQLKTRILKNKALYPYMGLLVLLFVLFALRNQDSQAATQPTFSERQMQVAVPLIAVAKGEALQPTLMRIISVSPKGLSRSQTLQIVLAEDLNEIKGQLIAKKTLAPNRIVFWKDLSLKKNGGLITSQPRISYSKERVE
jgi:hypothetical protein